MRQKSTGGPGRLFALCFMAYSVIYIGRKNLSACLPGMISEGVIDKLAGGAAGTSFLAVYACGQLVNGLLGDKIDPKYMITGGLIGASAANILMSFSSAPVMFLIIQGFNGFFCSMLWSPVVRCLSEWLVEEKRASAGVKISLTIPLGSIAAYLICALFLHYYSWRVVFFVCGLILAAAAVIFFSGMTSLRGYIAEMKERVKPAAAAGLPESTEKRGLISLIISTGLLFAVGGILFNGILKDGLDLWVPSYISEFYGAGEAAASMLTAILPIVNLSGVFIARAVNEKLCRNEISTCALLFAAGTIALVPLILLTAAGPGTMLSAVAAVLLISVTGSMMLGINSMLLTFIPFRFARIGRSSGVTGFLNSCSYAAAALSGIVFGFISYRFGWTAAIAAFTAVSLLGAVVCVFGIIPWRNGSRRLSQQASEKDSAPNG